MCGRVCAHGPMIALLNAGACSSSSRHASWYVSIQPPMASTGHVIAAQSSHHEPCFQ